MAGETIAESITWDEAGPGDILLYFEKWWDGKKWHHKGHVRTIYDRQNKGQSNDTLYYIAAEAGGTLASDLDGDGLPENNRVMIDDTTKEVAVIEDYVPKRLVYTP